MKLGDLLTVREVSWVLGVSRTAVYQLIQRGTLPRRFVGRMNVVSRTAVEDLIRSESWQARARGGSDREEQLGRLGIREPKQGRLDV